MASSDETLYNQEGLDVDKALEYVGDLDLYREILFDYHNEIDERIAKVRQFIEARNSKEYTVEVHAIKSTSRMIGATELASRAEQLEGYGKVEDWDSILKETEDVLSTLASYKSIIAPHMVDPEE